VAVSSKIGTVKMAPAIMAPAMMVKMDISRKKCYIFNFKV